ncbi:MAG: metallophosphoesterase family protein [Gammaproteobacteria bacterium]
MKRVRVGLVADSHGYLDARIAERMRACDLVVHAGDIGNAAVLEALAASGKPVFAVRGNNDTCARWDAGGHRVLQELPEEAVVDLPGGRLVVVHGHREGTAALRHRRLRTRYPEARAVVYGHSHRLVCDCSGPTWVLNPGACGRARTFGGPSCLVLEASVSRWCVTEYREPIESPSRPRRRRS